MTDILLDFGNRTIFKDGDIHTGESDDQNKSVLLICEKGSFKEFPATCVGASSYLEAEDTANLLREIRTQFNADGMKVNGLFIKDGKLKVDAAY